MEFFRRYRTAILLAAAVGFAACTLSFAYLTSVVTSRFNGLRWNLPSRIYSDVKAVSEGLSSTPEDLAEKLRRLYYRQIEGQPERPGQFRLGKDHLDVWLRSFVDVGRRFEGFPVRIAFAGGK